MVAHLAFGNRAVWFGLISALAFGCNRSKTEAPAAARTPGAPPASTKYEMKERASAGFDACLVGKWKSTKASLQLEQVKGEGGENVKLEVAPGGRSTLDFADMAEIHAAMPAFKFDFRYSGKASATLSTPNSGLLESHDAEWSGLRVTATATIPGVGKMPLVNDTKVSELAALGKGVADSLGADSANPEEPAAPAPQGIDSSPVLSNSSYTCTPTELTLTSKQAAGATWTFAKQPG